MQYVDVMVIVEVKNVVVTSAVRNAPLSVILIFKMFPIHHNVRMVTTALHLRHRRRHRRRRHHYHYHHYHHYRHHHQQHQHLLH